MQRVRAIDSDERAVLGFEFAVTKRIETDDASDKSSIGQLERIGFVEHRK